MLNQEIQAKARLVKQGDIPEIRELAKFIQYLDEKYGVDSSDTKNTFGIVSLDRMLVSELYPSNLYFSLGGYSSDPKHLPKHGVKRSQNQEDMPHTHPAYRFYRKWNPFHIRPMTIPEYQEMWEDLKEMEQLAKEWKAHGNL